MGRIKLESTVKKQIVSLLLDEEICIGLEKLKKKSKSELVNRLLKEHFKKEQQ
jgi:hypothetical protein